MMDCAQLHDVAPELALGILSGQERAAALAHLETCPACQAELAKLAAVADGLVSLAPEIEPPVGFERAVMESLDIPPTPVARPATRRWTRRWVAGAAIAGAAAFGGGGWAIGALVTGGPTPAAAPAPAPAEPMLIASLTSAGPGAPAPVGRVWAYWGKSSWLFMALDDPAVHGAVTCELVRTNGTVVPVGSFALAAGYGWWGVPLKVARGDLSQARIVDSTGQVIATAAL